MSFSKIAHSFVIQIWVFGCLVFRIFELINQFDDLAAVEAAVDVVVDGDDGGERAATEAGDGFQCVFAIGTGLAVADAEALFERFGNALCAGDVAGGSVADFDDGFADGFEPELGIEGGDAVESGFGHVGFGGNVFDGFFGDVAEFGLHRLEQGNGHFRR